MTDPGVIERADDDGCAPPRGLFRHRDFVSAQRHRTERCRWLHLGPFEGGRVIGLPVGIEGRTADLSFCASFSDLELPASSLDAHLALADALVDWLVASRLEAARLTLPPRIYGDWIAPFAFALRARGWRASELRYSPLIPVRAPGLEEGWSANLRRSVTRLRARGARLAPAAGPEALAWLERYYLARERPLSAGADELWHYLQRRLPVRCFDVHEGDARIAVIVLYRFGDIGLYTFAARDPERRASAFAWLVSEVARGAIAPWMRWLDLGAAGYARPGFDFHDNGVIRFKQQFRPVFDARETLTWSAP